MRLIVGLAIMVGLVAASTPLAASERATRRSEEIVDSHTPRLIADGAARGERSDFMVFRATTFGTDGYSAADVVNHVTEPWRGLANVRVDPPEALAGQAFSIWVTGPSRTLGVRNGTRWVTCRLLADVHRGSQTYSTGPLDIIAVRFTAMTCRDSPGVAGGGCPRTYSIFDPREVEKREVASLLATLVKYSTFERGGRAQDRAPSSFEVSRPIIEWKHFQ